MATFETQNSDFVTISREGINRRLIKKEKFDSFNEEILGLGNIKLKSAQVSALSVIFDLEGFTNFCKQIDPQLAVPEYLSEFLSWIFTQVRKEIIDKEHSEGYQVFCPLPFLSKYLGDGILFLWDTQGMSITAILNVVISMNEICRNYKKEFLPMIAKKIISPPTKLRCGIARGSIYSVGNGNDFVGPCINMSARLQKLNSLTFSFSRRGLDPGEMHPNRAKQFITKKIAIRGIGEDELVCFLKSEFEELEMKEQKKFIEP